MSDDRDFTLLIAELVGDLESLEGHLESNRKAAERIHAGAVDELDYAALGYTLHNIYNLMENSFFRIAKEFENNIGSEAWNKELLYRMTLAIEGIRPRVIDRETAEQLDELRSFRHVFRNMYRAPIKRDIFSIDKEERFCSARNLLPQQELRTAGNLERRSIWEKEPFFRGALQEKPGPGEAAPAAEAASRGCRFLAGRD